jgi:hypothetical protein
MINRIKNIINNRQSLVKRRAVLLKLLMNHQVRLPVPICIINNKQIDKVLKQVEQINEK